MEVLKKFLAKEDEKIAEEIVWLKENGVQCVLSDAAYLAWCVSHLFVFYSSTER